jgi:parallel beta-helix repeat protein
VVTIRDGTYRESVRVRNGGTADRRIVFQAENRGGVVLTGGQHTFAPQGWTASVMQNGAVYVTLRGLIFRDYAEARTETPPPARPAVGAIRGWRVEDCLFDRPGYNGMLIRGNDVSIVKTTFQYAHTHALTASVGDSPSNWGGAQLDSIEVIDVVLRGNNTRPDPLQHPTSTKVVKFMMTRNVLVDNVESYENNGPGWWFDRYNSHYTIRNSYFHSNRNDHGSTSSGRGLYFEVNHGPGLIENNVIANNEREGMSIANSERVVVRNNLFVNNGDRCIILSATDRGGSDRLHDVRIEGNFCKNWGGTSAIHPVGPRITTPQQMQLRADGNTYDPGANERLTWWSHVGTVNSIAQMQALLGWERNGRVAPIQWPLR